MQFMRSMVWLGAVALSVAGSMSAQGERVALGASREVFVSQLGQPVRGTSSFADFRKCPGRTALAEWSVSFSNDRAIAITKNACPGSKHDPVAALADAQRVFPTAAMRGAALVTSDGWNATAFRSAALAKVLPRESQQACKGAAAPAGSFFYLLSPERSVWLVAAGLCP